MNQETRQWAWSAIFYGGWIIAVGLTLLRVSGTLGQEWGVTVILALGVAIAASVRLSRARLTETMLQVYRAGVETAQVQKIERDEMERRITEASAAYDKEHGSS